MFDVVQEIVNLFGLNYTPGTFAEFVVWFVLVMCAVGIVCGMIKLMLYISVNVGRFYK